MVSFLFNLLHKAVKRLSRPESSSDDCSSSVLELLISRWFVEKLFLGDEWLASIEQGEHSWQLKKKKRRKSIQVETSMDYLCSSEIGKLIHLAVESFSEIKTSTVVEIAVMRLFKGSKILLIGAQQHPAFGKLRRTHEHVLA